MEWEITCGEPKRNSEIVCLHNNECLLETLRSLAAFSWVHKRLTTTTLHLHFLEPSHRDRPSRTTHSTTTLSLTHRLLFHVYSHVGGRERFIGAGSGLDYDSGTRTIRKLVRNNSLIVFPSRSCNGLDGNFHNIAHVAAWKKTFYAHDQKVCSGGVHKLSHIKKV